MDIPHYLMFWYSFHVYEIKSQLVYAWKKPTPFNRTSNHIFWLGENLNRWKNQCWQKIRAGLYTHQSPRLWALTGSVLCSAWPRVGPYSCEAHGFRLYPIHFLQYTKDKEAKHQQNFLLKGTIASAKQVA
jgi:hypothetical protein